MNAWRTRKAAVPSTGVVKKLSASAKAKPLKLTTSGRMRSRRSVNTSTIIRQENTAHFSASGVSPKAR